MKKHGKMMIDVDGVSAVVPGGALGTVDYSKYLDADGNYDLKKIMDDPDFSSADRDTDESPREVIAEIQKDKSAKFVRNGMPVTFRGPNNEGLCEQSYAFMNGIEYCVHNLHWNDNTCYTVGVGLQFNTTSKTPVVIGTGDQNQYSENLLPLAGVPRISFTVLASLIASKDRASYVESQNIKFVAKNIKDITVIDYVGDDRKYGSHDKLNHISVFDYNRQAQHKNHKLGYSLVTANGAKSVWHRPATVVIRHKKRVFVLGQDENQYFGCELPAGSSPTTVAAAFEALKPTEVKKYKGKVPVMRQGEWFAVPVNDSEVCEEKDSLAMADYRDTDDSLSLPRDDENSAYHHLTGETRISKDGKIYSRNFSLSHSNGDHQDMEPENDNQWYTFYRNTAVASYSHQGMD